jgi:hypothetical protein
MMQYLDFSHASTSRKWTNKRQPGEGTGIIHAEFPLHLHLAHHFDLKILSHQ